ncbi:ImmA/IrrE family metallo-endopeptidase [Planococcus sp. A6]|uniref:ImmA/IrrE family metallo-endopeptidase n=1 Tax=Planococcus sp. A6 TaxID=2992760 RepID=UPI00237C3FDA|nr:ImmA/IrrE family metallo-endopeptidase [Planococcus sp. A6]MDE0581512.1 ImmA/IrrE family metallo-endopeptidase [Planococcus sp. A6]
MNLYNHLEEYINKLLNRIDVHSPHQLNITVISARLGLSVHYLPIDSMYLAGHIFLDSRKTDVQQWQDFAHELPHSCWHEGDQALISVMMREYQEWKADNFARNLCIPTFMIENMKLPSYEKEAIWMLQETFGVEKEFAAIRLQQYLQNLMYR